MAHYIIEHMVYESPTVRNSGWGRQYAAGVRVTRSDMRGVWMVDGVVKFKSEDTFESRNRVVSLAEYIERCTRNSPRTITFQMPNGKGTLFDLRVLFDEQPKSLR